MHSQYGYTTADGVTYSCDAYNATSSDYVRFDVDMSADSIGDLRDDDDGGYQAAADFWTAIDELCVFPDDNDHVTTSKYGCSLPNPLTIEIKSAAVAVVFYFFDFIQKHKTKMHFFFRFRRIERIRYR